MFLSIEYHHEKRPRGWAERMRSGTAYDTPEGIRKQRQLLENERPPYCAHTVKWRDVEGIFWTIERWFIKGLTRFEQAHVLKRDCEAITVTGTITLPLVRYKYIPGKSLLEKGTHVLESVEMLTYDLVPSWFDEEMLKGQTLICRVSDEGPRIINVYQNFHDVVIENDNFHPVVTLR